jgi:hypothetical protein
MSDNSSPSLRELSPKEVSERALFKRLVISHFDLVEARGYLDRLLVANRDSTPAPSDGIQQAALMTALVVSYGRLFSANRGTQGVAPSLPARFLRGFCTDERRLHEELIESRNQEFAHSDADPSGVNVNVFASPQGTPTTMPVSNRVRIGYGQEQLEMLSQMLTRLYEQTFDEMRRLETGFRIGESF